MSILDKIKRDHTRKSKQVKELKRKLKNRLPVSTLKQMLSHLKAHEVDTKYYMYAHDDEGFKEAEITRTARIELLEELIRIAEKKKG